MSRAQLDVPHSVATDDLGSQFVVQTDFIKSEKVSSLNFDFTDLKIFLSAVEGGSLTAAAAKNNIVVAAVSARLKAGGKFRPSAV